MLGPIWRLSQNQDVHEEICCVYIYSCMVGLATRASNEHIKFGDKENIKKSGVTIMMENNVCEGEQKSHSCCRKDNGPLTVQLFLKDRH